jgi:hypothetical protein
MQDMRMIDLANETLLGLAAAGRRLPAAGGKPVHPSTVFRWVTTGVRGPDGSRVRLNGVRVGGRWMTSVEALDRFACALTPSFDIEPAAAPRTSQQRVRASDRAALELEKLDI